MQVTPTKRRCQIPLAKLKITYKEEEEMLL